MLTTTPPPGRDRKCLIASRAPRKTPRRQTASTASKSAALARWDGPARWNPALLTRMSSRPAVVTTRSTMATTADSTATSASTRSRRGSVRQEAAISARACSAGAGSPTWLIATVAPSSAKRSAIALPIPLDPPVTSATRPASRWGMGPSLTSKHLRNQEFDRARPALRRCRRLLDDVDGRRRQGQITPEAAVVDVGRGGRHAGNRQRRPPFLQGQLRRQAQHLVVARRQLLAGDDLVDEHGDAIDLGIGWLLDLDLLPNLPDKLEPRPGALPADHHYFTALL